MPDQEYEEFADKVTESMLVKEGGGEMPIWTMINTSIANNYNALISLEVKEMLERETVDVLVMVPVMGNEGIAYYIF